MKLTVVGCSGSFPSAESACSSYLVEADGFRLLLDMGNGALGELQRHCGLYDLDAIFLSHLHADHCIDMCAYFVARYYRHDGGRCRPDPRLRTRGHGTAPDHRVRGHPLRLLDERGLRLPHGQAGHVRDRPVHRAHGEGAPPRGGVRHPRRARRPVAHVLRGHGRVRRAGRTRPGHRPVPLRGRVHARQGEHPRPPPQRPRGGRDRHPRRRPPARPHPHPAVDGPAGQPGRRPRGVRRTGGTGRARACRTRSEPATRSEGPRSRFGSGGLRRA